MSAGPVVLDATVVSNFACSESLPWLREQSIPVTGSIGLLVLGIQRETVSVKTADRWLEQ